MSWRLRNFLLVTVSKKDAIKVNQFRKMNQILWWLPARAGQKRARQIDEVHCTSFICVERLVSINSRVHFESAVFYNG